MHHHQQFVTSSVPPRMLVGKKSWNLPWCWVWGVVCIYITGISITVSEWRFCQPLGAYS